MLPRMTVSLLGERAYVLFGVALIQIDSAARSTSPPSPCFTPSNLMSPDPGKSSSASKIYNDGAFLSSDSLMGIFKADGFSTRGRSEPDDMENRELSSQITNNPCSINDLENRSGGVR